MISLQWADMQNQPQFEVSMEDLGRLEKLSQTIIKMIQNDLEKEDTQVKILDTIDTVKAESHDEKFNLAILLDFSYRTFSTNGYITCELRLKIGNEIVSIAEIHNGEDKIYTFHNEYENNVIAETIKNIVDCLEKDMQLKILSVSDLDVTPDYGKYNYKCIVTID
jgi:hypothetical protein